MVHVATMDENVADAALERPDLLSSPIPPPIKGPHFTVQTYKNEIIVCGGKLPNNAADKHCWWKFVQFNIISSWVWLKIVATTL